MMNKDLRTSVMVSRETRDRLGDMGKKNETYDSLINRLLDHYYSFTISPTTKGKRK